MELSEGASELLVITVSVIAALASWGRTPARRAYYATLRWHRLRLVSTWSLVLLAEVVWAVSPSQPHGWFNFLPWTFGVLLIASWRLIDRRISSAGEPSLWQWDSVPPRRD